MQSSKRSDEAVTPLKGALTGLAVQRGREVARPIPKLYDSSYSLCSTGFFAIWQNGSSGIALTPTLSLQTRTFIAAVHVTEALLLTRDCLLLTPSQDCSSISVTSSDSIYASVRLSVGTWVFILYVQDDGGDDDADVPFQLVSCVSFNMSFYLLRMSIDPVWYSQYDTIVNSSTCSSFSFVLLTTVYIQYSLNSRIPTESKGSI